MGNINQGILGGFNGKVGTVVGYSVRGKFCMRSYVAKIRNPRTEKQMLQRGKFGMLGVLSSEMLAVVQVGFAFRAKRFHNSAINNFVQVNKDCIAVDSDGIMAPNYESLLVSSGSLPSPSFGTASFANSGRVEVPFSGNTEVGNANENDNVYIYVYAPDAKRGYLSKAFTRASGSASVNIPSSLSGLRVHVWGFSTNANSASDSVYVGTGTIA